MRLWKHKNGVYYVLYGPEHKRRVSSGTRDLGEANKFLADFIHSKDTAKPASPTVGWFLDHYRDGHRNEVRAQGAMDYAVGALRRHLADFRPEQLLPPAVKKYARDRKADGVGAGTILREIGVLRAAFAWAVAHRTLAAGDAPVIANPVRTPRPREIWIPRGKAPALIQACQFPHLRLFVKLGLMTLARTSAILELQWPAVSLERRLIDYGEGHGNKRRAVVPINDELLADLQAAQRMACTRFVVEYRGQAVGTVKNAFRAAVERAGLPSNVTPHILRHTGCTWLVEDGVSYEEIGKMAGDTAETIERVYGHHSPAFLAKAAASLQLENRPA